MQINKEYESGINIRDLFFHILYHWRSIIIAVLIGALLLGGYTWLTNRRIKDNEASVVSKEKAVTEENSSLTDLTENYTISNQIYQNLIAQNRDYYDHSIMMAVDPYHVWKSRAVFSLSVKDAEPSEVIDICNLMAARLGALISSNISAETLCEITGISSPEYAKEAISISFKVPTMETVLVYNGTEGEYSNQSRNLHSTYIGSVLIDAIGINEETAKKETEYIESVVRDTVRNLEPESGKYTVDKIDQYTLFDADKNIENTQLQVARNLSTYQAAITANNTAISKAPAAEKEEKTASRKSVIKYALIGAILGLAAAFAVYAILYILDGKLHGADVLKEQYYVPLYGEFFHSRARRPGRGVDGMLEKWESRRYITDPLTIYDNICALIREHGEQKTILLTGTIAKSRLEEVRSNLAERLKDSVILKAEGSFPENNQAITEAAKADAVILVEEKYVSRLAEINNMAEKLVISQANAAGSIVL